MTRQRSAEGRARHRAAMLKLWSDPAFRQRKSDEMRRLNEDPAFAAQRDARARKAIAAVNADQRQREARALRGQAQMRALNSDPVRKRENARRGAEHFRKLHADPEFARVHAERRRADFNARHAADPDFARRASEAAHEARFGFRIPEWVRRAGLADDFRDVARADGEEAAATHCRALKRELSDATP